MSQQEIRQKLRRLWQKPEDPWLERGPGWFTIPAHRPFLSDLALSLGLAMKDQPEDFADCVVLLPTRRAVRAMTETFLRVFEGQPRILPVIRALGDLEAGEPPFEPFELAKDLPQAISPLQRRFELMQLIEDKQHLLEQGSIGLPHKLELAKALESVLDTIDIEEVTDLTPLSEGLLEDHAVHWQKSAQLLSLATELWPKRLKELGLVDVQTRKINLLRLLADLWRKNPPSYPLIAAGSTGTVKATADLLGVIGQMPKGFVILPGLDYDLAESAWSQVTAAHPQGALKKLLDRTGLDREDITLWPSPETALEKRLGRARRRIINEALRPVEATADWRSQILAMEQESAVIGHDMIKEGLDGLSLAIAKNETEAATMAALFLRETLEKEGQTAALITPDPYMGKQVATILSRWGVKANISAGEPLSNFPLGLLLSLMARTAASPCNPILILAILKNPLTRLGYEEKELQQLVVVIEKHALRGLAPKDWEDVLKRLEAYPEAREVALRLSSLILRFHHCFTKEKPSFAKAGLCLIQNVERLVSETWEGPQNPSEASDFSSLIWGDAVGTATADLIIEILDDKSASPLCQAEDFAYLMDDLIKDVAIRESEDVHPALQILGTIEARLIRADRFVLLGLEEGVWPKTDTLDPLLSRRMREALNLPPPERKIGLSAHDFAQAACARRVLLITSEKRAGNPCLKSRWLWRLETLIQGAGTHLDKGGNYKAWARAWDAPLAFRPIDLLPARQPRPRPPLSLRPRKLSVTSIEAWFKNPYEIYAKHILRLRPLDRPDQAFDVRLRGQTLHKALEELTKILYKVWPQDLIHLPQNSRLDRMQELFVNIYMSQLARSGISAWDLLREGILAKYIGKNIAHFDDKRRKTATDQGYPCYIITESSGAMLRPGKMADLAVTARADRLELIKDQDQWTCDIIDFKTGTPPGEKQMHSGLSPQLALTAAILRSGGFTEAWYENFPTLEKDDAFWKNLRVCLTYIQLKGREGVEDGIKTPFSGSEALSLIDKTVKKLDAYILKFDDENTSYHASYPSGFRLGKDYDHLARLLEWAVLDEDEESE